MKKTTTLLSLLFLGMISATTAQELGKKSKPK
jgi:hypothetical protein